jgi:hypothetical protein
MTDIETERSRAHSGLVMPVCVRTSFSSTVQP